MKTFQAELDLAIAVVKEALAALANFRPESADFEFDEHWPREMKASVDRLLEEIILKCLLPRGIAVLSEEAGTLNGIADDSLRWVVDPLDGTVNFIHSLPSCAVSIALCKGEEPIFGVVGEYPSGKIAWGGKSYGAFLDQKPLRISSVNDKSKAILCTGFPSRFDFSQESIIDFANRVSLFGKVRMLGSASMSLLYVAKGAADAYTEKEIMFWDVAAGLALVQGAGGKTMINHGRFAHSLEVFASNGLIRG